MMNRNHVPLLLLALFGVAAAIASCSTSDTTTDTALERGIAVSRVVTVLQSEG